MTNLANIPVRQKQRNTVSTKARQSARGEHCTLRLVCCNGDPETTVLAHIRKFGWAGTSQKPPDYLAVYACSACHDATDGRVNHYDELFGDDDLLRALGETLMRMEEKGILKFG